MRTDIHLALAMARDLGIPLPHTGAAAEMLDRAVELGYGRRDIAAVFEVRARTNVPPPEVGTEGWIARRWIGQPERRSRHGQDRGRRSFPLNR
jgi:hypothetical protein